MRQLARAAVGQQGSQAFRPVARQRLFVDQHAQLRRPLMRLKTALAADVVKRRHRRMAAPETQLFAIARGVAGRAFQADGDDHAARIVMLRLLDERKPRAVIGMHEQQALVDLPLVGAALSDPGSSWRRVQPAASLSCSLIAPPCPAHRRAYEMRRVAYKCK